MLVRLSVPPSPGNVKPSNHDTEVFPGFIDDNEILLSASGGGTPVVVITREECVDLLRRMDECKADD